MRKARTIKPLIAALSAFDIVKTGRHYRVNTIEDEFHYNSPFGEHFTFVLIHDDTPERFASDFRALLNTMAFRATEYEQDIQRTLIEACEAIERIVKGE